MRYCCCKKTKTGFAKIINMVVVLMCLLIPTAWASSDSRYDLRTGNFVSPIRDQGKYGTCWSFSALASYESNWRMQLNKAGLSPELAPDFSERYLAWLVYAAPTELSDESFVHFTVKPRSKEEAYSPEALIFNQGGNAYKSTAIMTRGLGIALEAEAPYSGAAGSMQGIKQFLPKAGLLHDVYGLTGDDRRLTDIERQKLIMQENGAIRASILVDYASFKGREIYNVPAEKFHTNHAIALVGWDNDYVFENFTDTSGQPLKGAWILRNSWGTGAGEDGYYYISYQDGSLSKACSYIAETDYARYTRFDQYAPLGLIDYVQTGNGKTANFSSHYKATAPQFLKAVGFYVSADSTKYTIEVSDGAFGPESGKVVYTQSGIFGQDGSAKWNGYRTVDLKQFVLLPQSNDYVVTVKLENENGTIIPVSYAYPNYSDMATSALGNCFFQENGIWYDVASINPSASVAMTALSKDSILANGGDFTAAWLNDGGLGGSFVNLGEKDTLYGSDPLNPDRKTLSNMTVDLTSGETDSVYGGVIFGEGKVVKEGTGKLTLVGDNLYTGGTEINNGTLSVTRHADGSGGSIQGDVNVNHDNVNKKIGRLQGNGTVYGAAANSGIVAPGNSIGTLTVGSFSQSESGILELEGGMNGGDKLRVVGNADIQGTIHFIPKGYFANGDVTLDANDFIEADTLMLHPTQITGEDGNSSTVSVAANNQNGTVSFTVSRAADAYSKTAATTDGYRLGSHLNQVAGVMSGDGCNLVGAIDFLGTTVDGAGIALQPRPYDSLMYSIQTRSREVAGSVAEHMLQQEPLSKDGWNMFAQPLRITGNQTSWRNYDGFDNQSFGLLLGGERQIDDWRYSMYTGYLKDRTSVNSAAFLRSESKGGFLGVQGLRAANPDKGFFTYGSAQVGFDHYDATRQVVLSGYSRNNDSRWTGYSFLTEVGAGWKVPNKNVTWVPLIALNYSVIRWPGFSETCSDGNGSSLQRTSSNLQSLQSKLGVRAEFGNKKMSERTECRYDVTALWQHECKSNRTNYDWSALGGWWHENGFGSPERDTYSVSVGAHFVDDDRFALRASLGKQFGSNSHGSKAGIECNWYF